ncbi:MAG: TIGR00266 family protein [Verrucomicrobiota bacterium]
MAEYEVVGNVDPFLLVRLKHGEKLYCESNAMVTMDGTLELKGEMQGGLLRSLTRRLTAGESFFQQKIEAVKGDGETLLAPNLPGDIMVLDVGSQQYRLNDGAFLAADTTVTIETRRQGIGQALFGGTGGFFIMETSGTGKIAISGFGALFNLDVKVGNDMVVDNSHVVAWDAGLRYEMTTATAKGGFLAGLANSVTSGEGVVQRFSGNGKVVVCSRNRGGFISWLASRLPGGSS